MLFLLNSNNTPCPFWTGFLKIPPLNKKKKKKKANYNIQTTTETKFGNKIFSIVS